MKLEDQVCSLELAKRLKELGVKQESLFYWYKQCSKVHQGFKEGDQVYYTTVLQRYFEGLNVDPDICSSAFTVAELGELLPEWSVSSKFCKGGFMARNEMHDPAWNCVEDTEANARAKMLVYLLENKLI